MLNDKLTEEDLADALYILAQLCGTCGDYGLLSENLDLKEDFEKQARSLMLVAAGTSFCSTFTQLVDSQLAEVGQ